MLKTLVNGISVTQLSIGNRKLEFSWLCDVFSNMFCKIMNTRKYVLSEKSIYYI